MIHDPKIMVSFKIRASFRVRIYGHGRVCGYGLAYRIRVRC